MQVVELNLATRPFKNDTLPWVGLAVAVGLLGYLSWWNVQTWQEHRTLLDEMRESQVNISARFDALDQRDRAALRDIEKVKLSVLNGKADKANEVIRWKAFSWTRLFNLLQEVQPWNVQMSSVHPVFRGDRRTARHSIEDFEQVPVSVEGLAKGLKDFLEFERELIFDPHFDRVEPENIATDDNSGETIFRLRFLYDPRVGSELALEADAIAAEEGEVAPADADSPDAVEGTLAETSSPGGPASTAGDAELGAFEESGELASDSLQKIERGGSEPAQDEVGGPPAEAPGGDPAEPLEDDHGSAEEPRGVSPGGPGETSDDADEDEEVP
jgi:hypothetical protein